MPGYGNTRKSRMQYQVTALPPFVPQLPDKWFMAWSEPVRFKRDPRYTATLAAGLTYTPYVIPPTPDFGWIFPLSEPVRLKQGLNVALQKAYWAPARVLPTANVTATMAATDVNSDIFLGAINVYDSGGSTTSGAGAKVSITEISVGGDDPFSIEES